MTEYLITDIRTLAETWTRGVSRADALICHENARRRVAGEPELAKTSRVGSENNGDVWHMWIGGSVLRGRRENVFRGLIAA